MGRLPFDPSKMAPRSPARSDAPLTVSELARRLGDALAVGFPATVRVVGEVSGFKPGAHWYFSLKDAEAVVPCVMFGGVARGASFKPADGAQVVVTGRPDFWAKGGRTSLIVTRIEPVGEGALDAAFRVLCDELRALGWFDAGRKRPVPEFPGRVAVVTSRSGAAIQDVLDTMRRRCAAVEVALVDVPVQGQGAAERVAGAIRWLGRERSALGIDVILVTRGGGSKEDLWTFNERVVAAAIVESPVPVVAAIGHEVDTTIAELVADLRCATPTQAAMQLTPDARSLLDQLASVENGLRRGQGRFLRERATSTSLGSRHLVAALGAALRRWSHALDLSAGLLERQRPTAVLARRGVAIASAGSRLEGAIRRRLTPLRVEHLAGRLRRCSGLALERAAGQILSAERQLWAVGPMGVLRRGYSYTVREDGALVRAAGDVRAGDRVRTRVAEGEFSSIVEGSVVRPRRQSGRSDGPPDQMDLFKSGR
jgi:exodeoxyribonuclease VII large subunit